MLLSIVLLFYCFVLLFGNLLIFWL